MPLITLPRAFHVNSAGTPYGLAKLYHYRSGTTTLLNLYTTNAYDVAHDQPVVADANGVFPAMYLNPSEGYNLRVILKTSADVEIYDQGGIPYAEGTFGPITATSATITGNVTATGNVRAGGLVECYSSNPRTFWSETDRGTDLKNWDLDLATGVLSLRTRTDADGTGKDILKVTRGSTTVVSSIVYGNSTDNPSHTFYGAVGLPNNPLSSSTNRPLPVISAYKTATTSRNTTTTLADDTHLVLTVDLSGAYEVEAFLMFKNASVGGAGFKYTFAGTATLTADSFVAATGYVNAAATNTQAVAPTTTQTHGTIATAVNDWVRITGFVNFSALGTFKLQWAQNTSDAANTSLLLGSFLRLKLLNYTS